MKISKVICSVLLIIIATLCPVFFVGCTETKIKMYDITTSKIITLNLEDYVSGVVAAELGDSFAEEALKAQAVIARTYALWFKNNNMCKYDGADISNDITEAQAYTTNVSDKIKKAAKDTAGLILTNENQIILPYYCANCGGANSLPTQVFENNTSDYLTTKQTLETAQNSKDYSWNCTIEKATILYAMQALGKSIASVNTFSVEKTDSSGRAISFKVGGVIVNANAFRLNVGSTILKSCKITDITINPTNVTISGIGYGHGVGLSQWGANILANDNYTYNDILLYYYENCQVVKF